MSGCPGKADRPPWEAILDQPTPLPDRGQGHAGSMKTTMKLDEQGMPVGHPFNDAWELTPRAVADALAGEQELLLIDCRTDQEREIASIEGSMHVPMDVLATRLDDLREHEDDVLTELPQVPPSFDTLPLSAAALAAA